MKTAVIYQSHYGYTKQYAQWIAQSLNAPLFEASQFSPGQISEYGQIIFGGALYAGRVSGIQPITENAALFAGKKLIVFAVGMGPHPGGKLPSILAQNKVPKEASCFYLRGGMDVSKLNFPHKMMIALFRLILRLQSGKNPEAAAALEAFKKPCNFVSKDAITPLLEEACKNS